MRKKIITIALLSLLLIGCNKASDTEVSNGGKSDDTGGKITDTSSASDTDYEGKTEVKDTLFKEAQAGIVNFYKNDQSVTYDVNQKTIYQNESKKGGYRYAIKGTFDQKNGHLYETEDCYTLDSTLENETLSESHGRYIGTSGDEYRAYFSNPTGNGFYTADKASAQYYYEKSFISSYTPTDFASYIETAPTFASFTNMMRYVSGNEATEFSSNVEKTEDGVVLSLQCGVTAIYDNPSYIKMVESYSVTVKDGFVTKFERGISRLRHYPNGYEETNLTSLEVNIRKGFDETFYKTITDLSSYTDMNRGLSFTIPVYYNDYYFSYVNCNVGEDMTEADAWANVSFDGLYYDKELTIPYNSKKPTMDVKALYVKLRTDVDSTKTIVYQFREVTVVSYNNILPTVVDKSMDVSISSKVKDGSTTEVSWNLDWFCNDEDNRKLMLEKMYVNGVETTEDTVDFTLGTVNTIKHTYSTYSLY